MENQTKDYFSNALNKALEETYNEILKPPPPVKLIRINMDFDDCLKKQPRIIEYGEAFPIHKPNSVTSVNPTDETSPNPSHASNHKIITVPKCHFLDDANLDGQLQYTDCIPDLPRDFIEKYLKYVFNYEKYKEEAERLYLAEDYTMKVLIDRLKFDIFIWVASELLFKKPLEYSKSEINIFYKFDIDDIFEKHLKSKYYNISRMALSNYKFKKFKNNCTSLTNRIKSFPMPPHLLYSYTDLNKTETLLFLTDPLAYEKYNLINFLDFQRNIRIDINHALTNILPDYSNFFSALIEFYLERVFNFDIVNTTIEKIATTPDRLQNDTISLISNKQLLKSDNVFTAKPDYYLAHIIISQAIEILFPCIAKKTLDNFTSEYQKEHPNPQNTDDDFTTIEKYYDLLNYLSNSYAQLFPKSQTPSFPRLDYCFNKLTARERFEIFYLIANPYTHPKYNPSELLNDHSAQIQFFLKL